MSDVPNVVDVVEPRLALRVFDGPQEIEDETVTIEITVTEETAYTYVVDRHQEVTVSAAGAQGPAGENVTDAQVAAYFAAHPVAGQVQDAVNNYLAQLPKGVDNSVYVQGIPADVWVIDNPLPYVPAITVYDSMNREVEGDFAYDPLTNQIKLTFSAAFSGRAFLS